jgi:hypothetical protein
LNLIGLDPGVETGLAHWSVASGALVLVDTVPIHRAMDLIRQTRPTLVLFEDARLRRWGFHGRDANEAKYGSGVREGAGSAKRDAKIWEDFLSDIGQPFLPRHPRKKLDALLFKATTGYQERTSQHARDAAMLVFNYTAPLVQALLVEYEGRKQASENTPAFQPRRRGRGRR